jgi:dephospho-CoA kinase
MKTIGITGGIGSGKTILSRLLTLRGIPVYNADQAAKQLHNHPAVKQQLAAHFGPALYHPDGQLNRPLLAAHIFTNPESRRIVHHTLHPAVEADFNHWKTQQQAHPLIGIESAILFETSLRDQIDHALHITAPLELRIRRVQQRDNLQREAILQRIHSQISDAERDRLADHTIINDERRAIIPQVEKYLETLNKQ